VLGGARLLQGTAAGGSLNARLYSVAHLCAQARRPRATAGRAGLQGRAWGAARRPAPPPDGGPRRLELSTGFQFVQNGRAYALVLYALALLVRMSSGPAWRRGRRWPGRQPVCTRGSVRLAPLLQH